MTISKGFRDYLADVLTTLGKLETKRVFGLDGIKFDGVLLGFVIDEQLFLRTDVESCGDYVAEGGAPYTFSKRSGAKIITSYYRLPDRLYDEPEELVRWAHRARAAALETPSAKKRRAAREHRTPRDDPPAPRVRPIAKRC